MPTIDERLDKLTERQEAFAMNLELMQKHFEERMTRIETTLVNIEATTNDNAHLIAALTKTVDRLAGKLDTLAGKVDTLTEQVTALATTVNRYIAARGNGDNGQ